MNFCVRYTALIRTSDQIVERDTNGDCILFHLLYEALDRAKAAGNKKSCRMALCITEVGAEEKENQFPKLSCFFFFYWNQIFNISSYLLGQTGSSPLREMQK